MRGNIFDIKRYAIHDGPGIRTTGFLKGCRLHCRWCHNPESQAVGTVSMKQVRKLGDREFEEIRKVGYGISVDELVEEIAKDAVFFEESGGGVTFSGGEPLLQPVFLLECLKACKARRIHTCIDTAGVASGAYLEEICRYTDLFLYDVKTADPQKFEAYISKGFREACEHLRKIAGQGAGVIVRIPVIPGFNDDKKSVQETIRFLQTMPVLKEVNLLPFHRTGADKYKRLGMDWEMGDLPGLKEEDLKDIREMFREQGFRI